MLLNGLQVCLLGKNQKELIVRYEIESRESNSFMLKVFLKLLLYFIHLLVPFLKLLFPYLGDLEPHCRLLLCLVHDIDPFLLDFHIIFLVFVRNLRGLPDVFRREDIFQVKPLPLAISPLLKGVKDEQEPFMHFISFLLESQHVS